MEDLSLIPGWVKSDTVAHRYQVSLELCCTNAQPGRWAPPIVTRFGVYRKYNEDLITFCDGILGTEPYTQVTYLLYFSLFRFSYEIKQKFVRNALFVSEVKLLTLNRCQVVSMRV